VRITGELRRNNYLGVGGVEGEGERRKDKREKKGIVLEMERKGSLVRDADAEASCVRSASCAGEGERGCERVKVQVQKRDWSH
jgi:hypothetical protein